jgi:hypothetical protein
MSDDRDEEQKGIVKWLLDVGFGRRTASEDEERRAVHRLGTLARRQKDDDED